MDGYVDNTDARMFARYAGDDINKWQALVGCEVTHCTRGHGLIERIVRGNSGTVMLMITHYQEPKEPRRYSQEALCDGRYFSALSLPQDLVGVLEPLRHLLQTEADQEQRDAALKAATRQRQEPLASYQAVPEGTTSPKLHVLQPEVAELPDTTYNAPRPRHRREIYRIPIYHFTSIDNLPSILAEGCLWCESQRAEKIRDHRNIAHEHLKERRTSRHVPCAPGGVVADYVPFYFATRSPMLYAIHKGNVEGYCGGQRPLVYLVSSIGAVVFSSLTWLFTDGHAAMRISHFYQELRQLRRLDWELLKAEVWANTEADQDRKRRRHAEFLVHRSFPWTLVQEIGVIDITMEKKVATLLMGQAHQPRIVVRREWYF